MKCMWNELNGSRSQTVLLLLRTFDKCHVENYNVLKSFLRYYFLFLHLNGTILYMQDIS